jgi:hypothetical protein
MRFSVEAGMPIMSARRFCVKFRRLRRYAMLFFVMPAFLPQRQNSVNLLLQLFH